MNPLLEQHRTEFNALERELYQLLADINPKDTQLMNLARTEVLNRFEAALSDARFEMGVRVYDGKLNTVVLDREVLRDTTQPKFRPIVEEFERVAR